MAKIDEVAAYILERLGSVSTMKLHKLTFYSQAYSLVEYGVPLFSENFEAWVNGPVAPELFKRHKGEFVISHGFFGPSMKRVLAHNEIAAIDHVVNCLRGWTGAQLSALAHAEEPWREARVGLVPSERSQRPIAKERIAAYYETRPSGNPVFA